MAPPAYPPAPPLSNHRSAPGRGGLDAWEGRPHHRDAIILAVASSGARALRMGRTRRMRGVRRAHAMGEGHALHAACCARDGGGRAGRLRVRHIPCTIVPACIH